MKTIMTIAQQTEFLATNWKNETIEHTWSTRGTGSSRLFNSRQEMISKANGCGYDRFGKALGYLIETLFNEELQILGKRHGSKFYGMNNYSGKKWTVDGACGSDSMIKILAAIGFDFKKIAGNSKSEFYSLSPVSANTKKWLLRGI